MAKYKSDINLFDCIFKDKTKKAINLEKEIKKSLIIFGIVAVSVGGVLGVVVGGQKALLEMTKANTAKLRETYDFDAIAAKKLECEKLTADNQKIQDELVKFNAAPQFKTELFSYIAAAQPEGLSIKALSYNESRISMQCVGPEELTGAQFANRLREQEDIFSDVEYLGAMGEGAEWSFSIDVTVRNKAEEEEETATAEQNTETTTEEAK